MQKITIWHNPRCSKSREAMKILEECGAENDVVKYSRRFGLTIYEMAKQNRDFISDIRKNMDSYTSESEIKLTSFKNYMDNETKEYYTNEIVPIFKQIDNMLGR